MSIFQWPLKRIAYPGIVNPRFVDDIVVANESILDGLRVLTGLNNTDFAIISGLEYITGTGNTYNTGFFYLNGNFYFVQNAFAEGLYLAPNPTDTEPQPFTDGNTRNIYTLFPSITTSSPSGATPVFSGDMNEYRIGMKTLNTNIQAILGTILNLGTAAFLNVGTAAGTVAAGDASYTKAQITAAFLALAGGTMTGNLFLNGNPTSALEAAPKQYVDNANAAKCIVIANYTEGTSTVIVLKQTGALTITGIRVTTGEYVITHNIGNSNYFVTAISITGATRVWHINSIKYDINSFTMWTSDDASAPEGDFSFQIWAYQI